jgi:hypothetical protein
MRLVVRHRANAAGFNLADNQLVKQNKPKLVDLAPFMAGMAALPQVVYGFLALAFIN